MTTMVEGAHLIHDWNAGEDLLPPARTLSFDDETLRDGLQSPSVKNPTLEEKVEFLHRAAALGITSADVGLPGAGPRAAADARALVAEIVAARLPMVPNCAARTTESDIVPILEIAYHTGCEVEIALFVGASPIRLFVEGWTLDDVLRRAERCVRTAVAHQAPVTFVTEDTTRSHPEDLARIVGAAVRSGARRVCVADTVGHATPAGAARIVRFMAEVIRAAGGEEVGLDWHGHNDRGLATANALAAAAAGADRLHGTVLGVGERVGNAPMEQLLVNARLLGWCDADLSGLSAYVRHGAAILGIEVPPRQPVVGRDAYRTSTGVHAAAILKATAKGEAALADLVYSAVPASWVGERQVLEVGPMSGASNVRHWLAERGYEPTEELVARLLAAAKRADRILRDEELQALVAARG